MRREYRDSPTPPSSDVDCDEEPRNADAVEAEPEPCRPGLQPKLNTVLCREASDVAPGVGTFTRAEASLLFEGTTYSWPMSDQDEGFDGSGPFLAARMKECIANATGDRFQTFSDALLHLENITGLETMVRMLFTSRSDLITLRARSRHPAQWPCSKIRACERRSLAQQGLLWQPSEAFTQVW